MCDDYKKEIENLIANFVRINEYVWKSSYYYKIKIL